MDSLEVNKAVAAVLVVGIVFFLSGTVGMNLVQEYRPEKPAIKIDVPEAASPSQSSQPAPLPPIANLLAKADAGAGEAYVKKVCTACHTFTQGGKAGIGPNLYNVVGGPHAHMAGFNYSNALKSKTGPWTFDELNEWLHKPSAYAPGTRMTFAGINNDQERANVIDYLHTLSPKPMPLPPPVAAPAPAAPAPGSAAAPAPAAPAAAAPVPAHAPAAPAPASGPAAAAAPAK